MSGVEQDFQNPEMTARDVVLSSVIDLGGGEWVVGMRPFTASFLDGRIVDITEATIAYGVFPSTDPMFDRAERSIRLMQAWMEAETPLTFTTSGESTVWSDGDEVVVLPRGR